MTLTKPILADITAAELSLFSARTDPRAASFHLLEAARFAKRAAALHHARQVRRARTDIEPVTRRAPSTIAAAGRSSRN